MKPGSMRAPICAALLALAAAPAPRTLEDLDWRMTYPVTGPVSESDCCDKSNMPEQLHLQYPAVGSKVALEVMWLSLKPYKQPVVEVVQASGRGNAGFYDAQSSTYDVPHKWWQRDGWIGTIYRASLGRADLPPGETYTYRVGDKVLGIWSAWKTFRLPRSGPDMHTTMVTYGDMGVHAGIGADVFKTIVKNELLDNNNVPAIDFILHVGDICYASIDTKFPLLNVTKGDELEIIWDKFGRQIEPLASVVPYQVSVGNHDVFYNTTALNHRYHMPENGRENRWWSTTIGNMHIISISSEDPLGPGSPQYAWLTGQLEAAAQERSQALWAWLILALHRPILSSDRGEYDDMRPGAHRQTVLEPLLHRYNVDLTLTGHMHAYERIHPNRNGTVSTRPSGTNNVYKNPDGPVELVVGHAGAVQEELWVHPEPEWSATRYADASGGEIKRTYGYERITAVNSTHLHGEFVPIEPGLTDVFWVVKGKN